jgi:hypothetical protein
MGVQLHVREKGAAVRTRGSGVGDVLSTTTTRTGSRAGLNIATPPRALASTTPPHTTHRPHGRHRAPAA